MKMLVASIREEIISLLNGSQSFVNDRKDWARRRDTPMHHARQAAWLRIGVSTPDDFQAAAPGMYEHAGDLLRQMLRGYMNEWLDSGFKADVETPSSRSLPIDGTAYRVVRKFLRENPPTLNMPTNGGVFGIFTMSSYPTSGIDDICATATREAARLFTEFMDSELRWSLALCRKCDRYYIRKKVNSIYKRGAFCRDHQSTDGAQRRTKEKRESAKDSLYQMAANQFGRRIVNDSTWHTDKTLKIEIAGFLKKKIDSGQKILDNVPLHSIYRRGLTEKWVSNAKNYIAIQRIAEEMYAKR